MASSLLLITWMDGETETYETEPHRVSTDAGQLHLDIYGDTESQLIATVHFPLENIRKWKLEQHRGESEQKSQLQAQDVPDFRSQFRPVVRPVS